MNSKNDPLVKVKDEILKLLCKVIYTFLYHTEICKRSVPSMYVCMLFNQKKKR